MNTMVIFIFEKRNNLYLHFVRPEKQKKYYLYSHTGFTIGAASMGKLHLEGLL